MIYKKSVIAWVLLLSGPVIASNSQIDAPERHESTYTLMTECRAAANYEDTGWTATLSPLTSLQVGSCQGYIKGLRAGVAMVKLSRPSASICIPESATNGQLARVFLAWTDKHPEALHKPMLTSVIAAWASAFPCGTDG